MQPNNGTTNGYDLSLAGEVGYDLHFGPVTHGPVGGFILQQAMINGFTESGSFTSLSFGSQVRNSEVSLLGYQARYDWGMWHPFAQVLWDHEFDPLNRVVTASLTTIAAIYVHGGIGCAELFDARGRAGPGLGDNDSWDTADLHPGMERAGLAHGAIRPAARDGVWRLAGCELRVRSGARVADRRQELKRK